MARMIDSEIAYRFLTEQLVKESGAFSKGVNKGLNIARSAMRNPDAIPTLTPPNEPLTLEQLREMDGEPVWFDTIKRWGIVKVNREGIFVVTKSGEYEFGRCKVYRRPPEEKKNASPDLISRSALLRGETEPEIITGSDSELAEHMEWERWMDKIKRAPAVDKEEEP